MKDRLGLELDLLLRRGKKIEPGFLLTRGQKIEPGVVDVFLDVELVLLELAAYGPVEVDPAHPVRLVEGAPEVLERQVDPMFDAEVGLNRAELRARLVAVATRKNDVASNEECGLQL